MPSPDPREPTGLPGDWWMSSDIREYLAGFGVVIARSTWSTWVKRGHAPSAEPSGKIGAYPRWRPDVIRDWFTTKYPNLFR